MVADGEESLPPSVPNHKRIITDDTVNEVPSPKLIGLENHLGIGGRLLAQIMNTEIFRKLFSRVNADMAAQPSHAIDRARLVLPIRFGSRVKSSVYKSDVFLSS